MNDLETRLRGCFGAVFPGLPEEEIGRATPSSVANWDSLANLSLITVIEEEFGIQIDSEDVDQFLSFELILDYLQGRTYASQG